MRNQAILDTHPVASFINGDEVLDINYQPVELNEDLIQERLSVLNLETPFVVLRNKRNELLFKSDWMAVSDRTMTPEQIAYRQALRDMPANNPDVALNEAGELINITWPTEPTT